MHRLIVPELAIVNGGPPEANIHEFSFEFDELGITKNRVAGAMGYGGSDTGPVWDRCFEEIQKEMPLHCSIKAGFRLFPREIVAIRKDGFSCAGLFFDTGKIIADELTDAEEMVFFLVTAGPGIDAWSKSAFAAGDFLEGYMIDTCGSEIAEAAAGAIEKRIVNHAETLMEKSTTSRYSPGYCGWNTGEQQKLFSLLPEKFCGVTLTGSSLMVPIKSISGCIGIGKKTVKKEYRCSICAMENCLRRK
jgi:hypothetical protein